ncbi:hypothetical protein UB45_17025 [Terrabacter sp. 28]|nr:hypothetical protein UB45_17025 [Terrabacter sp. 28]
MRRRERETSTDCPPELARFDPAEWSGTPGERVRAWYAARVAHDGELPDPPEWPDAPFDPSEVWPSRHRQSRP